MRMSHGPLPARSISFSVNEKSVCLRSGAPRTLMRVLNSIPGF